MKLSKLARESEDPLVQKIVRGYDLIRYERRVTVIRMGEIAETIRHKRRDYQPEQIIKGLLF